MPLGLNPLTLERNVPIDDKGVVVGAWAPEFLRITGFSNAWDYEASRDPTFKRPDAAAAATTQQTASAFAVVLAALNAAGINVGTTTAATNTTTTAATTATTPPTIAAFRKTYPQPVGRNWTNAELNAIRLAYKAKYNVDPGAHVWTAGNAPAPDWMSNRAIVPNAPPAPLNVQAVVQAGTVQPVSVQQQATTGALSLTWSPSYAPNQSFNAGVTAGQLLVPNYLTRRTNRGGEEGETVERLLLDPGRIEESFRLQTGVDIRTALREVAPGFDPGAGPITLDTLSRSVAFDQVRAPAKDGVDGMLAAAALIAATIATAGGAAAAAGAVGAGLEAGMSIPELGLIADQATAAAAVSQGIPASMALSPVLASLSKLATDVVGARIAADQARVAEPVLQTQPPQISQLAIVAAVGVAGVLAISLIMRKG